LGSKIHSVPRSSRRHGAQLESSSSSASSASAAVTLAREAQTPKFLKRSTNSKTVQRRDSPPHRDVEELLAGRGPRADHVTVWRWVQRYAQELERRLRRRLKPTSDSWRVDETYIRVRGKWCYLYRSVD
jgi:hypothetical protein